MKQTNFEGLKKEILSRIKKTENFNKLEFIILFGSKAREKDVTGSDIDLCFYYSIKNKEELQSLLLKIGKEFSDKYDIQMFQLLPLYVRIRIIREGKVLYYKNEDLLYDVVFNTIKDFEDFKPIYKNYLEAVLHAK